MIGYRQEAVDLRSVQANQGAAEEHVDDIYFTRRLTPGMFTLFGGAAHGTAGQSVGLGKWPTIDYPDAVSSYGVCAFERPKFWVSGRMQITIYYTSQAAGTANFNILVVVNTVKQPGNLSNTGITTLLATMLPSAGPTVADDEKVTSVYTTTSFNPSARRIGIRIGRDGADINNNVLQVTEVVIKHIPARQTVNA